MRWGLVGCGYFGQTLARAASENAGMSMSAVVDTDPDAAASLADRVGCARATDATALASRDDVDAVLVATPNHAHAEPVIATARAGKHVFVEKPMAVTSHECDTMLAATRAAGTTLVVGHVLRMLPGVRRMRQAILAGDIGRPVAARAERIRLLDAAGARKSWWKLDHSATGGELFHEIHDLDLLCWLLPGEVAEVSARAGTVAHADVIQLSLQTTEGALATLEIGGAYHLPRWASTVHGEEGSVELDLRAATVRRYRHGEVVEEWSPTGDAACDTSLRESAGAAVQRYNVASGGCPEWLDRAVGWELRDAATAFAGEPSVLAEAPDVAVRVAERAGVRK